ncbi:PA4642 family protein [Halopseudomonas pelagia]|uniref:PA4642 family protein n=1 Tax=Halopseudomonas pelagia TaxID=553151 RepID=UPI00039DF5B8|nr:PA4642 family protein [Halopseudomonas pelagia]
MRKDKEKVIGESMTDEQVAAFLQARPYAGESLEQHILTRAYRGLRVQDFERFLAMFKAQGFDLDAADAQGNTFLHRISAHAQAQAYVEALKAAGAKS